MACHVCVRRRHIFGSHVERRAARSSQHARLGAHSESSAMWSVASCRRCVLAVRAPQVQLPVGAAGFRCSHCHRQRSLACQCLRRQVCRVTSVSVRLSMDILGAVSLVCATSEARPLGAYYLFVRRSPGASRAASRGNGLAACLAVIPCHFSLAACLAHCFHEGLGVRRCW